LANKPFDLEVLREIFKDQRRHIAVGKITKLGASPDRSCLRVQVLLFDPTLDIDQEIVAIMGWDDAGPDCGSIRFPETDDLVLVAFVDGDANQAYVIKRLTSKEEKLPIKALDGHTVLAALSGKNTYVSGTAVHVTKSGADGTENFVLGQVFKTFAAQLLDYLKAHQHTSAAPGVLTSPPSGPTGAAADFAALKASPINDSAILSNVAFTEKGA
jgi:translation initiation factor IF-1